MKSIAAAALTVGLFVLAARSAAQTNEKPNFTGTWTLDRAKCDLTTTKADALTWEIEQKGPTLKLIETSKGTKLEYQCATTGKECEVGSGKEAVKISMYFNGATLVQFHRGGQSAENVSKQQWQLSEDKKGLTVDIVYIVPDGKAEKLVFAKQQ